VEAPSVLHRAERAPENIPSELHHSYQHLGLKDVDLGFSGRYAPSAAVHRAIAGLSAGDAVTLRRSAQHWELCDQHGHVVGRLSKAFAPPVDMRCLSGQVSAVIVRRRMDSEPQYQATLRCEQWEVVLPELIFEPDTPRTVGI
jgi:ATP-dependent DNA helicase RecQ